MVKDHDYISAGGTYGHSRPRPERARGGDIIEVTSHHKPIAGIIGIPEPTKHDLGALVAEGLVRWKGGKTLSEMILADRHCSQPDHMG